MRMTFIIISACFALSAHAQYYNVNTGDLVNKLPATLKVGNKIDLTPSRADYEAAGWVHVPGGRAVWVIDVDSVRRKTEAEMEAERLAAVASSEANAEIARRNAEARVALPDASELELIAALANVQNQRINLIVDEIIRLAPQSSKRLSVARLTFDELKKAVKQKAEN